jgi:hypothetical protein
MQHLPPTPPPSLPATERAIDEAEQAFDAGHRVPLVGASRDRPWPLRDKMAGATPARG